MANTPISGFTARTIHDGSEEMVVAYSGNNRKYDLGVVLRFADAEYTSAGVLVYPSFASQSVTPIVGGPNDGAIYYYQCTYNTYTWTLEMTTYDGNGNVTLMTADNGAGGGSWTRTLGYTDGLLTSDGGWV